MSDERDEGVIGNAILVGAAVLLLIAFGGIAAKMQFDACYFTSAPSSPPPENSVVSDIGFDGWVCKDGTWVATWSAGEML